MSYWPSIRSERLRPWRVVGFVLAVGGLYFAGLLVTARLSLGPFSLLARLTGHDLEPGGKFQSLRRFREADASGPVDIVFLGSSHAYRGFDPRLFAAEGYAAFNLGSTNQTPLNARSVAERYVPRLRPKLVVVELYPHNLSHDGAESTRDLLVNTSFHASQVRMAAWTRQLGALHYALAKGLRFTSGLEEKQQHPIEGETYVAGGYCETRRERQGRLRTGETLSVSLSSAQRAHLVALTRWARERGAKVVWVTHPLPSDHLALIVNHGALRTSLAEAAKEVGVEYWDYNERLALDPRADFMDFHHLNQRGVVSFNRALLADLKLAGYLPP